MTSTPHPVPPQRPSRWLELPARVRIALGARREEVELALSAAAAVLSSVIALACAVPGRVSVPPAVAPEEPSAGAPSTASTPPAAAAPAPSAVKAAPQSAPELAHLASALRALEAGERVEPVRMLWLGDSHAAADFWTGAIRSALQERYPPGGPGFLRLGVAGYRHDQASETMAGRCKLEPNPPARRTPEGDGVFGLGGLRALCEGPAWQIEVEPRAGTLRGRVRYEIELELAEGAQLKARVGEKQTVVLSPSMASRVLDSPILRIVLEGAPGESLVLSGEKGRVSFYGVVVEGTEPGFVLDTVGIDGARLATALAWSEATFVAEVRARHPDLVAVAYGTNEAFDERSVDAYASQLLALLGRLKAGAKEADCLVMGPPDAKEKKSGVGARLAGITEIYRAVAGKEGCFFLSARALMGGPGSFVSWQNQDPQLGSADGIHLTPRGYRRLGQKTAQSLFLAAGLERAERYSP